MDKKQPTEEQFKKLRLSVCQLRLSNGNMVYYSLGDKDSNTGFFSNQRLLLYHSGEKSLRYYSKLPKGLLFTHQSEVVQGKDKVYIKVVQNFKCRAIPTKIATWEVEWEVNGSKKQWIFIMKASQVMSDWVKLLNEEINNSSQYKNQLKEQQLPKPINKNQVNNNSSQYQPIETQKKNNPLYSSIKNQKNPQQNNQNSQDNQNSQNNQNNQNNQSSQNNKPFNDVVEEIKYKREHEKDRFNLTNELSNKKYPLDAQNPQFIINDNRPYNDIAGEIQYKRQHEKNKFNLTNDLSVKKIQPEKQIIHNQQIPEIKMSFAKKKPEEGQIDQRPISREPSKAQIYGSRQKQQTAKDKFQSNDFMQSNPNFTSHQKNFQQSNFSDPHSRVQDVSIQNSRFQQMPRNFSVKADNLTKNNSKKVFSQQYNKTSLANISNHRRWNEEWCEKQFQYQIQVYQDFVQTSSNHVRNIIDQIAFLKKNRQFAPIQANPPYFIYRYSGILIIIHYDTVSKSEANQYNEDAPLTFSEDAYEDLKRQFDNYDLIIRATGNQGFIKVPLCCYFEYKGMLALCKAQVPQNFQNIKTDSFDDSFQALEEIIKCKFPLSQLTIHIHPTKKYILINDLQNLIPKIPSAISGTFSKQYLLKYQKQVLNSQSLVQSAHHYILRNNLPQFISRYESLQLYILNTLQLNQQLENYGLNHCYLSEILQETKCIHLRKIITTEVTAKVFANIMRSQLNHTFAVFPAAQLQNLTLQTVNNIILDGIHTLINEMFSYTQRAQNIWKVIVSEVNKKYRIVASKEDLIIGFLLSSVILKMGIQCEFKDSNFNPNVQFFIKENTIPRDTFVKFNIKTQRYPSNALSPLIRQIDEIIHSDITTQNFQSVVKLLSLTENTLPDSLHQLRGEVISYLANYIPFDDQGDFLHLNLYEQIVKEPHTRCSMRVTLLAIKWAIKQRNIEIAIRIFQDKCQENSFWLGEFNPTIGQFYDFFSMYYASIGNYDESIKLAKSSLVNAIKILGTNALPIADKHYQLGNIYFKISQKEQALKQYTKTQQILQAHSQTNIPQYGVILLKMGLLYLNFGKIKDSVVYSLEAVKIFDINGGNQKDEIQTFEILARAYQITRKPNDMMNVGGMCGQKFNLTEDSKIFQRMLKIVLYPKISLLNSQQSKSLQSLLYKLQELDSPATYLEAFSFFHRKAKSFNVSKRILSLIDNVASLYQEATRRDLFRNHKSLNYDTKSQAHQLIVMIQAVCIMIGYGFILGSLKETYYD